jgi:GAF domain-containing protein
MPQVKQTMKTIQDGWISSPRTKNEEKRLNALRSLGILDTVVEDRFDVITKTVAELLDMPVCLITLVDADRQWFKSVHGDGIETNQTDREISFCAHNIHDDDLLIIPDARKDDRFRQNPCVLNDPKIRFYAGAPLEFGDECFIGSLCVIDYKPIHDFSQSGRRVLKAFSKIAVNEMMIGCLHPEKKVMHG